MTWFCHKISLAFKEIEELMCLVFMNGAMPESDPESLINHIEIKHLNGIRGNKISI